VGPQRPAVTCREGQWPKPLKLTVLRYKERYCAVLKFPLCTPRRLVVEDNSTHAWTRLCIGVRSQLDAPAAVVPQKKDPRYQVNRRLVGPHNRSGRWGEKRGPLPLPGIVWLFCVLYWNWERLDNRVFICC